MKDCDSSKIHHEDSIQDKQNKVKDETSDDSSWRIHHKIKRPLGSDRRRQQNGTSIETSGTEGNGFQHPLLSRPSQSGDLGSTRLSRGTSYHNLESLSGWNVVVAPSNMFDAPVLPHNHVHSGVPPTPLGDNSVVYTLTRELLKKLASIVPSHRKFFIVELSDLARSLSIDGNKSKGVESDGNQEHVTMWKLHVSLEPLWQELSDPSLPHEIQRLLPFIEAFIVLCDKLQENRSLLQQNNACVTESKIKQSITSSSQSQTTQGTVTFPNFTEKHSRLLNAFVRQDPGLLEKSLSKLLKAHKLMDFDNKRVILDKGSLLFTTGGNNATFQPNPNSVYQTEHLSYFKFVGRVVAKALFDGQLLDVYFTRSFYKHILGFKVTYHDIEAVDPDYYKNLKWMLGVSAMDADEEKHILYEKTKVSKPGGGNIRVTEETKQEYVDLVADYKLTSAIRSQINSFLESFSELIPRELISIFNDKELELLNNGLPEINLNDLQANTKYSGYTTASNAVTYIQRGQPDAGFPLFESESLKWPGSVEFDDVNGKVLTYSAQDSTLTKKFNVTEWKKFDIICHFFGYQARGSWTSDSDEILGTVLEPTTDKTSDLRKRYLGVSL
ncbi:E3 ubiquitin protein ligase UPL1-like protein isoform X1 [Tanacetum coccineum]